jgi:hypothetical protein
MTNTLTSPVAVGECLEVFIPTVEMPINESGIVINRSEKSERAQER